MQDREVQEIGEHRRERSSVLGLGYRKQAERKQVKISKKESTKRDVPKSRVSVRLWGTVKRSAHVSRGHTVEWVHWHHGHRSRRRRWDLRVHLPKHRFKHSD